MRYRQIVGILSQEFIISIEQISAYTTVKYEEMLVASNHSDNHYKIYFVQLFIALKPTCDGGEFAFVENSDPVF